MRASVCLRLHALSVCTCASATNQERRTILNQMAAGAAAA